MSPLNARRRAIAAICCAAGFVAAALVVSRTADAGTVLKQDGFESGSMSGWTASAGMTVQETHRASGLFGAVTSGSVAWAEQRLGSAATSALAVDLQFKVLHRIGQVTVVRLRTDGGGPVLKVMINAKGQLVYRNDVTGTTRLSSTVVAHDVWHRLELSVSIAGSAGQVRVNLDGAPVAALTNGEDLGTTAAGRVEIGNRPTGKVYQLAFDDVMIVDDAGPSGVLAPRNVRTTKIMPGRIELAWDAPSGEQPARYGVYRDGALVGEVAAPATTFADTSLPAQPTRLAYRVVAVGSGEVSSLPSPFLGVTMSGFASTDAVVYAAGDVACTPSVVPTPTRCRHAATSDLVTAGTADAVLLLGDVQYETGRPDHYQASYHPTWGRALDITSPAIGNHEYRCGTVDLTCSTPAGGYFGYFGARAGDPAKGYYATQVAGWTVLSLNSNCRPGKEAPPGISCDVSSPQYAWLQSQLASDGHCTIAMWHHPRYSSGAEHGGTSYMDPMFDLLASQDVELLLQGHEHLYERFHPLDAAGAVVSEAQGVRSFIVGTGGKDITAPGPPKSPPPTGSSAAAIGDTFGVLKLSLHEDSYDWRFVPEWGRTATDAGSGTCS